MSETAFASLPHTMSEPSPHSPAHAVVTTIEKAPEAPQPEFDDPSVEVGTAVFHAKFGNGTVTKLEKAKKHITVTFTVGEKIFAMPDCFTHGFLKLV